MNESDQETITKIRNVFKKYNDGMDYNKKSYYIIQSNTTNIDTCLHQFPNNTIVIQVDPKSSGIFRVHYNRGFNEKIKDFNERKEKFYKEIYLKNKSFGELDWNYDKIKQEIELSRTIKEADEIYDEERYELFKRNFYNVVEAIDSDILIKETINNINLEILKYDLKNKNLTKSYIKNN